MEAKRILISKPFVLVLVGLVLLNCFFFFYDLNDPQTQPKIDGGLYDEQLEALSQYSVEEAYDWCVQFEADAMEASLNGQWDYYGPEQQLLEVVLELKGQYEYLLGYDDYLAKIKAHAKLMQSVSLFGDPDSIAYKNIEKTAEDFAAMDGVEVTAGRDLAVTSFFNDKWADYSILLVICVVCAMFLSERKIGLWPMIHAAPKGRWALALQRVGILFAAAWIGAILILGSKILLCGGMYHGLDEWGRTLQSIPMFQNVPTPMTVGQFWLLYIAVKAVGAFWFGLVLWAILSAISNLGLALCAVGLVVSVEFACTAIPSSSIFAMLRYVNIFSYVDFSTVFTRYLNLNVFGTLISGCDLVLAILVPLCLIFMAVNILIGQRKHPVSAPNRMLGWMDGIRKKLDPVFAGGGELRKLMIRRKGLLLLILLVILVSQMEAPPRTQVPWYPYIDFYQQEYAGPITPEKLEEMELRLENTSDMGNIQGLTAVLDSAKAALEGAWILPTAPYDVIWSNNEQNYHRTTALTALLFLVLILAPIASQERQDDMPILLRSTRGGRKKLMLRKQIVLVLVTAVIWALIYGTEWALTAEEYGTFGYGQAPAYSLELFRPLGLALPLSWTLPLYYAAKLLVMVAAGEVCFFLSSRCAKNRDATLLCCGVILIPAALAVIGASVGEFLSFLLPLDGAEILHMLG